MKPISPPRTSRSSLRADAKKVLSTKHDLTTNNLAGWHGDQLQQGHHGDAFAGAALTDHTEKLALAKLEAHTIDRVNNAILGSELGGQIYYFENRFVFAQAKTILIAGVIMAIDTSHTSDTGRNQPDVVVR